ncbi:uncharacterized protein FIBRA_02916 [Fibroporia radiculosa]|uniref:NADP-dependent oxidoreductase domain-containing protein n=1 Tax=Fibroporia radiculosa TaxID=599839 RepID=J4GN69_9APHY|nr:uncharacterized protein FIBRA_02916 [Fibroporia radiculosa]CCM00870.1 predicted protein [Fibroporia radiculosa]
MANQKAGFHTTIDIPGTSIPSVAFGTWKLGQGQQSTDHVEQAISIGFNHIGEYTAQAYRNESEAGIAIRESGLPREDLYITTKFSGRDGLDIETSIQNSLDYLGLKYVDLYLIHAPSLAVPDIPTAWAKMEKLREAGLAKRIYFQPYILSTQMPIVEYGNKYGIVSEAYSVLTPLTSQPGGPVDKPLQKIASRLNSQPEQVLLAWAKSKGVVAVTASTKKERLEGYLAAGDLELTAEDIAAIDAAGLAGESRLTLRKVLRRAAYITLVGGAVVAACTFMGIRVL